jgi:PAS domain S-box-containing protein
MSLSLDKNHIHATADHLCHAQDNNKDNDPLYNSRNLQIYLEYVEKHYPHLQIDSLLAHAEIARYEIEDQGHWITQRQADRFHRILVEKTGDPNISRKVGRYSASSKASGAVRQYTLGFMSPAAAYWLVKNVASRLTRGHKFETKKLGPSKVEIVATPHPGVSEKPYQCEVRMGLFEALSKLFTNEFARIEHPVCIHEGGEFCRYIISWQRTRSFKWKWIRNYLFLLGIGVSLFMFFVAPFAFWAVFSLLCSVSIVAVTLYAAHFEKEELVKTIEIQGNAANGHLDEMNIRYNNALLVQEIGQATSTILNTDKLIKTVIGAMERRLDFDRGMIMLADEENTRLVYSAGYGYGAEQENLLRDIEFHLDDPKSKGVFVIAFREQKPLLLNDITEDSKKLSKRSWELANEMGVKSMICVPLVYEKQSLGIVAVDNIRSKRPLTQSDMSVLMGVASQTAVSIINARSFQKLQESEEKYRTILESIEEGYFETDLRGNMIFFNDALRRIAGYSREELLGMNYRRYTTPESATSMYHLFNKIYQTGNPERIMDYEVIRKGGDTIVISMSASLIRNSLGEPIGFRGVVRDITEAKHAEEALRASEERYHGGCH